MPNKRWILKTNENKIIAHIAVHEKKFQFKNNDICYCGIAEV
jgi:hypothetical protein